MYFLQKNQADMQDQEELQLLHQQIEAYGADFKIEKRERQMAGRKVLEIENQVII